MTEEILTRQLKIYCPTHQATFEIAESPKIVCEIREHALSNDFPKSEFWEYCCDCQTYFPSDLEVGGKGKDICPQCERTMLRRFVCDKCKIVTYDSGEDTKGKIFHLDSEVFVVAPACPGCLKDFSEVKSHLHKCEETQIVLATPREVCPFCKKETVKAKPKPKIETPPVIKCSKCQANSKADSFFCNNCGEVLRSNPQLPKHGTSTAKTRLLGSICPNCGIGNPPNSDFCGNCRQALKSEKTPSKKNVPSSLPPPVSPVSVPTQVLNQNAIGNGKPPITVKARSTAQGLTAAGIILGLVIACCAGGQFLSKKSNSDSSISTSNSNLSSSQSSNSFNISNSTTSSNTFLPNYFSKDYSGTIGGRSFTMSLTRDGSDLKGTASTSKTDSVYGTIDSDGSFTVKGYENGGNTPSGIYNGRIYSNGSISGTWTNLQGGQGREFSLSEE